MFKHQSLQLPEGLTPEQKEMVLNSLIAQQLNATLQKLIPGGTSTTTASNVLSNTPNCNSNHEGGAVDSAQSVSRPSGIHGNKSVVQSVPSVTSTGNATVVNSSSSVNLTLNDVSNKASEQKVSVSKGGGV